MALNLVRNPADEYIVKYCTSLTKNVEYGDVIARMFSSKTLMEIDEGSFDFTSDDETESIIIDRLFGVIQNNLRYVSYRNTTGYFGVIRNTKRWNSNWSYLNLNENRFIMSQVIYASSLDELERKVKSKNYAWYIFDDELAGEAQKLDSRLKRESEKSHSRADNILRHFKSPKPKPKSKFEGKSALEKAKLKREIYNNLQIKKNNALGSSYNNLDKMFR